MVNCAFYPEKCIARNLYSDKRSKFNNSRIKDATIQKPNVINTFKGRIKNEGGKKYTQSIIMTLIIRSLYLIITIPIKIRHYKYPKY